MSENSLEQIERQIGAIRVVGPSLELRDAVLSKVHRELHAARWDRHLARFAAVLLVIGVGMNVAIGLQPSRSGRPNVDTNRPAEARQSLLETAVVVAQATDAATALQFARQLAAMTGRKLTADESAAIGAAVERHSPRGEQGNDRG
jgi:hypothetical protein